VWVINPLVLGLVALPLTLASQVRRSPGCAGSGSIPPARRPPAPGRVRLATAFTLLSLLVAPLILYLTNFGELYPLRPDVVASY
jgi:hypothetical protein